MTTGESVSLGSSINVGEVVHIALSTKAEDQNPQVDSKAYIHMVVKVDGTAVHENDKEPVNNNYATVKDLLTYVYDAKWEEKYEFKSAKDVTDNKNVLLNDGIKAGNKLEIELTTKKNETQKPGQNNKPGQDIKPGDDHKPGNTPVKPGDKFEKGDVLLKIYVNGNTKSAAKVVDMASYAKDNKITLTEAEKVVRKYYEEKDSDDDMDVDGLFTAESWNHGKYNMRQAKKSVEVSKNGDTIIYVMVRDAQKISSSTSTADTSNPKTGDNIMMVVSVMVMSGAALAYVFSKKRAAK